MIARTVFHIHPTDPLIQLARISRRHGQHDIRSVDYYCSKSCGSNELTSPLRNHCRDLTRLAICQNRVWLWDLFPKRSRTISPTVLRLAVCLRLTFTPAHFFFHRVDVSTHRDELRNVRRDVLVASWKNGVTRLLRENNAGRCDGLMAEYERKEECIYIPVIF